MIEPKPMRWRPVPQAYMTRDPRVLDLSWADRGLLASLFAVVDDAGRFLAHPRALAQRVGWHDGTARLRGAVTRLASAGLVELYEVDGHGYGAIVGYQALVSLSWASEPVYPAPRSGDGAGTVSDTVSGRREKREDRKQKTEKPAAGLSQVQGAVSRADAGPVAATGAGTVSDTVAMAEPVKWPSPRVELAVRQWRGKLQQHQGGQRSIPEVTDLELMSLVDDHGPEAFIAGVMRHIGEDARLWGAPFKLLSLRCQWAADERAGQATEVETAPMRPAAEAARADDAVAAQAFAAAQRAAGEDVRWRAVASALGEGMSRADWMAWVRPLGVSVDGSTVTVVCPDEGHREIAQETFGARLAAEVVRVWGEGAEVRFVAPGAMREVA